MDILDLFIGHLGIDSESKKNLKAEIGLYTFDRAAMLLSDALSTSERSAISSFLDDPNEEKQQEINRVFSSEERQVALTTAFTGVLRDLIDDPEVVDPELRDGILKEMEQYLEIKQVLIL